MHRPRCLHWHPGGGMPVFALAVPVFALAVPVFAPAPRGQGRVFALAPGAGCWCLHWQCRCLHRHPGGRGGCLHWHPGGPAPSLPRAHVLPRRNRGAGRIQAHGVRGGGGSAESKRTGWEGVGGPHTRRERRIQTHGERGGGGRRRIQTHGERGGGRRRRIQAHGVGGGWGQTRRAAGATNPSTRWQRGKHNPGGRAPNPSTRWGRGPL